MALSRVGSTPDGPLHYWRLVTVWQLNALAVAFVVLLGATYLTGLAVARVRDPRLCWPAARLVSFACGLAVIVYATCGSIAVYDQVLFSAHMAGHLALVMLAPALLMYGRPLDLLSAATGPTGRARLHRVLRKPVASVLTSPPVALALYTAVLVGTHLTGLMNVIMRNTWAGQVEHLVYLVTGGLFFVLIAGAEPLRWQLSTPARWLLLAIAMAVDTIVGIVLLQGSGAVHLAPAGFVVDAASDTKTGGAIMWVGGDGIMLVMMIGLVVGWLSRADTAHFDEPGWLEQARRATLSGHLDSDLSDEPGAVDDDDAARESYNAWLASLNRR